MHFAGKFRRAPWVWERATGVMYLYMRMHSRSCRICPLKVVATLFSNSRKGTIEIIVVTWLKSVSRLHANTSSPDIY